jgi:mannose-1-phosphate guanylyltransferase/mannose-6-phosphate isomerase
MDRRIVPLIMCGGAGTRLWPASREVRPKQFLPLFGPRSTFQDTILRVSDPTLFERPIVITNTAYRFMVLEQLAEIGLEADVLLEPMRRDSGPAIAAGAAFAQCATARPIVLALAADHVVRDTAAFVAACRQGLVAADAGRIVTFGVAPERAATEYGYISPGDVVSGRCPQSRRNSSKSRMRSKAAEYVKAGYLWNSGNFMFRASVLLDEYRNFDAESVRAVTDSVAKAGRDLGFVTLDATPSRSAKAISIDYAVMEKTSRAAVVPVSCGWSDVGSWHAVWELSGKDARATPRRAGRVRGFPQLQRLDRQALVALEGVDDLVVVATEDAVLVSRQKDANGLKRLVAKLKTVAPAGHRGSSQGASPWGSYQSVDNGRASPGQAHRREAGRPAVAAETSPPLRALDRGARHRARHGQRNRQDRARE